MANYNRLVYSASEYKVFLLLGDIPFPLLTAEEFSYDIKVEEETGYAIGQTAPIYAKTNGEDYSGKASLQVGEINLILKANGLDTMPKIKNAQLGITSLDGLFQRIFSGVNILGEGFDLKAKDKNSKISFDWKAVAVKGQLGL